MLKLITAPAIEPVTLTEAKAHLRVDGTADDTIITFLIATARRDIETISLHALVTQTWDLYMDGFPGETEIKLPLPPLQSVTAIYYTPDATETEATFASTNYLVDAVSTPGRIVLKSEASWPSNTLIEVNGARIRFVCGYGTATTDVDHRLRQALMLLLGHYYENREAIVMGKTVIPTTLPMGVHNLCWEMRAKAMEF